MALAAKTGASEVGHQVRKRLAQLARSEAFIASEKAKDLATELERLRTVIVETIGADDPKLAAYALERLPTDEAASQLTQLEERVRDRDRRLAELHAELGRLIGADRGPVLERIVELLGVSPDDSDARLAALRELTELLPGDFRYQRALERVLVQKGRHSDLAAFYERAGRVTGGGMRGYILFAGGQCRRDESHRKFAADHARCLKGTMLFCSDAC